MVASPCYKLAALLKFFRRQYVGITNTLKLKVEVVRQLVYNGLGLAAAPPEIE